jgi:hypothetical protein
VLLLGALVVAAATWREYAQLRDRVESLSASGTRAEQMARRQAALAASTLPADLDARIGKAQQILNRLTFPWDELFGQLEDISVAGVALLEVQPDADRETVTLTGEAKDAAAMLSYVARLEQARALSGIHLRRHETMANEPTRPIRFSVAATWKVSS